MHFYKYQACGNDFVLVDNRKARRAFTVQEISQICDRRFGIGADGLILIEEDRETDFRMEYFNGDGTRSLCGNGCRTAVDLAARLNMIGQKANFSAYDGQHMAERLPDGKIRIQMAPVTRIEATENEYFVNTGSPHVVKYVDQLDTFPVVVEGRKIRNSAKYGSSGTNVNFIEMHSSGAVRMRTYERGVEDETLACGTGAVAVALVAASRSLKSPIRLLARGGELTVEFNSKGQGAYDSIFLSGPAKMVFEGDLDL